MTRIEEKLTEMYEKNWSLREIGQQVGRSHEWVRNNLPEKKIRHRKKNVVDYSAVVAYFKTVPSIKDVAKKFDITRNWVTAILDENGFVADRRKKMRNKNGRQKTNSVKRSRPTIKRTRPAM